MREFSRRNIKVWEGTVVFDSAVIGWDVSIGRQVEIGPNVFVGDRTRIGKGSFIPEGVMIGDDCFIGPMVVFTNDMFPPSPKDKWLKTIVSSGAAIGAGCVIRPGTLIGTGALVGCGSVVTCDIPPGEVWAGNPARRLRRKEEYEYCGSVEFVTD